MERAGLILNCQRDKFVMEEVWYFANSLTRELFETILLSQKQLNIFSNLLARVGDICGFYLTTLL